MAAALLWEPCLDGWQAAGGFFWVCSSPSLQGESSRAPSASCPGLCPPPRRRKRWGTPRVRTRCSPRGCCLILHTGWTTSWENIPVLGLKGGIVCRPGGGRGWKVWGWHSVGLTRAGSSSGTFGTDVAVAVCHSAGGSTWNWFNSPSKTTALLLRNNFQPQNEYRHGIAGSRHLTFHL